MSRQFFMSLRSRLSLLSVLVLAACASSSGPEYRSEGSKQEARRGLEVPPDLTAPGRDDRYQVNRPPTASGNLSTFNKPAEAAAIPAASPDQIGRARIVRGGNQRWLVVPGTPQTVWPKVRQFWENQGLTIKTDSPQFYFMETDWAEKRPKNAGAGFSIVRNLISSGERDRFRTRLETTSEPGMVELYVTHRGLEEVDFARSPTATYGWVLRPAEPDLELNMMRRLLVTFGVSDAEAEAAAKRPNIIPERAALVKAADGSQQLDLEEPFDRAWRQVGLTLDRVGMVVEDRDRAKSWYLVRYVTGEDLGKTKGGFWDTIAFWRSKDPLAETGQFRIVVQGEGNRSRVTVQDKTGAPANPAATKQILSLLEAELR